MGYVIYIHVCLHVWTWKHACMSFACYCSSVWAWVMYEYVCGINVCGIKKREILYSVSLFPHWLFMFPLSRLHTHQHTHFCILPVRPSLSIILLSMERSKKKWLSFKWPTQHGKITRLSSRSALGVDITLAHKKQQHTAEEFYKAMHLHTPHT